MYLWLVLARNDIALVRSCARTWTTFAVILAVGPRVATKECTAGVSSNQSGAPVRGQRRMSREHMSVSKCARPGVSVRWCDRICSVLALKLAEWPRGGVMNVRFDFTTLTPTDPRAVHGACHASVCELAAGAQIMELESLCRKYKSVQSVTICCIIPENIY